MPHYDYYCSNCHYEQEILQKMTDLVLAVCPTCHQETFKRKLSGGMGLHFKGSGFYLTDYPDKPAKEKPKQDGNSCPCGKPTSCS